VVSDTLPTPPAWLAELFGVVPAPEGKSVVVRDRLLTTVRGIPRAEQFVSAAQEQTRDAFGFKWAKRDAFEGGVTSYMRTWLAEKYGEVTSASWFADHGSSPLVLDAGCGAAMSGLALFEPVLGRIRYLGVDVSTAVDVAARRFAERGVDAAFLQADLTQLPLPCESVDLIFSEGVLHHTDNTHAALASVVRHLKPGGRILFYVYKTKGPIREFTDDYVRDKLQGMTPEEGWAATMQLSKLGKALGELNITVDVPEAVEVLEIPAGKIDLQRLFYWHVFKAFYRPEMTLDEMNHVNFDWYAPKNAHRQSPEEVKTWCAELGLAIEREYVEEAGITVIARKAARVSGKVA
jgi:ubiquinone/menaquinone biosynthesis C-methylase UbiE